MDKKTLDQKHPTYDDTRWCELDALAKGGKLFHSLIDTFLPQNPMEPGMLYAQRKKRAKYFSYSGAIINLYVSWLFAAGFNMKPYEVDSETPIDPDKFYGIFQEDVGREISLKAFMKERFREALTRGAAHWICELPPRPENLPPDIDRATWESHNLGRARLTAIEASELLDWETDDEGLYTWAVVKTCYSERSNPALSRSVTVENWRVYDAENVTEYELRYDKNAKAAEKKADPKLIGTTRHGFKRVPVITMKIPTELCIGEATYDAQISHFQMDAGLDWAILRTCYAVPVFKIEDTDKPPTMGVGYGVYIGMEESMEWASPPGDSFTVIAHNRDTKREEIFRICNSMAQGVDNNAETVGRSAESKEIDAAATRIMLNAYGELVAHSIEETYETISEARDEKYEWSVEGFSGYDTATAGSLLGNVKQSKDLGIPSETFLKEVCTKAALALIPEADQRVKDQVREEISKYKFEVTGQTAEMALADKTIKSQEALSEAAIVSQEKTAAAALKAKPVSNPSK